MARPFPPTCSNDPESLRQRVAALEDYAAKTFDDRTELERRIVILEKERAATAQGIDAVVLRMKEFGDMFLELPSAPQLRSAVSHLDWLGERRLGQRSQLEQVLEKIEGRVYAVEDIVGKVDRRMISMESSLDEMHRVYARYATLADSKADRSEIDGMCKSMHTMFSDLKEIRCFLDGKADRFEADRLAEALNQSYRDFTAAVSRNRHGLLPSSTELGSSLSTLDDACRDLKKSFAQRQEEAARDARSKFLQDSLGGSSSWPISAPSPPPHESSNTFQRRIGANLMHSSSSNEKLGSVTRNQKS